MELNEQLQTVIDIVSSEQVNYKEIALNLAKKYPDIFILCAGISTLSTEEQKMLPIIKEGNLVMAIREYRSQTGKGLKESKETVEAMERKFRLMKIIC